MNKHAGKNSPNDCLKTAKENFLPVGGLYFKKSYSKESDHYYGE